MSQTVNLVVANNVGYVIPEGKCFPCSRVYGKTTAVFSCPSIGRHRIRSHVKIGGLKPGSLAASFVCEASKNPYFSRQNNNRNVPSRDRNRNNDGRDIFENFEEDMLSSKNGSLESVSSGKFQATSSPGAKEREIVELFKKVQAHLRDRASSVKEEKKIESPHRHVKEKSENDAVDSLLKLLRKHSVQQAKKSSGEDNGEDHNSDQLQESNQYDGVQSTNSFDSNNSPKDESRDANVASVTRPRSVFKKKSPVPRVNVEPIVREDNVNNRHQIDLKPEDEPEPEPEPKSEIDLDTKDELFFPELSEDDSHDAELTFNDESVEEELDVQTEDLSALKLSELRAIAKSRGLKGYTKMKKVDLIELLIEN
ncbi:unnamed protein product [Lathyrus sativus]|nr:unnamed protein product [Lathyrus sativus]